MKISVAVRNDMRKMNDERMMTSASSAMIRPKNATLLPKMALSSVGESETVRAVAPVMKRAIVIHR